MLHIKSTRMYDYYLERQDDGKYAVNVVHEYASKCDKVLFYTRANALDYINSAEE